MWSAFFIFLSLTTHCVTSRYEQGHSQSYAFDVVVYGSTPSGIATVVTASKLGLRSALFDTHTHVGGMVASGLGWDDVYNKQSFGAGGFYKTFVRNILDYYETTYGKHSKQVKDCMGGYRHEPSVAEKVFSNMLQAANVKVHLNGTVTTLQYEGTRLANITWCDAERCIDVSAKWFVDSTYTADLMAMANMSYTIGRESRQTYGELNAGKVFQDYTTHTFLRGSTGIGDDRVAAMTFRLCWTNDPTNAIPLNHPPPNYNRSLYLEYLVDRKQGRIKSVFEAWSGPRLLPNNKFDINTNPRPYGVQIYLTHLKEQFIVANHKRKQEIQKQLTYLTIGLMYFIQNDHAVPYVDRREALKYNFSATEFTDNGYFPWQLYVREGRRLVGKEYILTEHDLISQIPNGRPPLHYDSIHSAAFPVDMFPATPERPATSQQTQGSALEGYVGMDSEYLSPYQIPLRTVYESSSDTHKNHNVFVGCAISASHVSYSSVRLEPTWMAIGVAVAAHIHTMAKGMNSVSCTHHTLIQHLGEMVILYDDVGTDNVTSNQSITAMQYFGGRGFANTDNYRADSHELLPRWKMAVWMNITANVTTWTPVTPPGNVSWRDFKEGMEGFSEAVILASAGVITPPPSPDASFYPFSNLDRDSALEWISALKAILPRGKCHHVANGFKAEDVLPKANTVMHRGGVAALLYEVLLQTSN